MSTFQYRNTASKLESLEPTVSRPPQAQAAGGTTRRAGSCPPPAGGDTLDPSSVRPRKHSLDALDKMRNFDSNGDGRVTFDEFMRACGRYGKTMSKATMEATFRKLDKDQDGLIDVTEFVNSHLVHWEHDGPRIGMHAHRPRAGMGHENTGSDRTFGTAGDRAQNAREHVDGVRQRREASTALAMEIARLKLQGGSTKMKHATGAQLRKAFQFFDGNQDGVVSEKEFQAAMENLSIPAKRQVMQDLVRAMDENKDGVLDYQEFCTSYTGHAGSATSTAASLYKPLGISIL